MSEASVTEAIWRLFDHPMLYVPVARGLTAFSRPPSPLRQGRCHQLRSMLLADAAHGLTADMAAGGRAGADLVITDRSDTLRLMVENKLATGPAQWTRVSLCDSHAVATGTAAAVFDGALQAALVDPAVMQHGARPHRFPCTCTWSAGWHSKVRPGEYECGLPQLDYYAYYRNWLSTGTKAASLDDVLHVFLSAGPVDLALKYAPLNSEEYWDVVEYTSFLNEFLAALPSRWRSGVAVRSGVADAVEAMLDQVWTAIPWSEVNKLSPDVAQLLTAWATPSTSRRARVAAAPSPTAGPTTRRDCSAVLVHLRKRTERWLPARPHPPNDPSDQRQHQDQGEDQFPAAGQVHPAEGNAG